jgi:hypothetical protein
MDRDELVNQIERAVKMRIVEQWSPENVYEIGPITQAAISGSILYAASKLIYKRKLSAAAQACRDSESMQEKTECMRRYKIRALQSQKQYILSGKAKCSDTDCFSYLDNQIANIEAQVNKLKG